MKTKTIFRKVTSALMLVTLLALNFGTLGVTPAFAANSDDFVITVKTDNAGTSTSTQFTIPTGSGLVYKYNVDCNNDGTDEATAQTGNYTCNYASAGTYTIRIKDNSGLKTGFPWIYFNNGGDKLKLMTIAQWGTGKWRSMLSAFSGCSNMIMTATDAPDLSGVGSMTWMFAGASAFNGNIGNWNTASISSMYGTFENASAFNQDISGWNTSNVTSMVVTFRGASAFNQNLNSWDTGKVTNMASMFRAASSFNGNISNWNTASVTTMSDMFRGAGTFNQDIGGWNTGNVTSMYAMFYREAAPSMAFNQNIGGWNTSKVTNMGAMFYNASAFNQNLNSWDTSKVTNMQSMFHGASAFNQNIDGWDTSKVTNMYWMFRDARAFNQNIGGWNTGNVTTMYQMFRDASAFNQNIGNWNVGALTDANGMFSGVTLSTNNYDALLNGWDAQTLKPTVTFSGGSSKYCAGETARAHMISSDGWTITDGGKACDSTPPITTNNAPAEWQKTDFTVSLTCTDNPGGSGCKETKFRINAGAWQTGNAVSIATDGDHLIEYYSVDNAGNQEGVKSVHARLDKTAPTLNGAPTTSPNANGWYQSDVTIAWTCNDALSGIDGACPADSSITSEGAGRTVSASVSDKAGNTTSATSSPAVNIDKTPPTLMCNATPKEIWPANHKLVDVTASVTVNGGVSGSAGFTLVSVMSNEPDDGLGDGDTPDDIQGFATGTPDLSGQVRAERSGTGTGRIYTLTYRGTDNAGNTAGCSVTLTVPKDKGK